MENLTKLAQDIKATAAALSEGNWTGLTVLRTITAEETGLDYDLEMLYFQLKDQSGVLYWVSEDEMDEMLDTDMQAILSA